MPSNKKAHNGLEEPHSGYIGRFAPSPTGPLHFGSALAAIASYLDARFNNGLWLIRMEDLDPPREPPGMAELILQQLKALGLNWDHDVLYQSNRLDAYAQTLDRLQTANHCFPCNCTRPQMKAMGSVYDGSCRNRTSPPSGDFAVRLRTASKLIEFKDTLQGRLAQNIEEETGDFVIKRKDKLFAYQLAVVVDDEFQNITHVVRGFDLLDSTARQIYLQNLLNFPSPSYAHIPIIVNAQQKKLSKQHFAPSIESKNATKITYQCLSILGQRPPSELSFSDPGTLLEWGVENWDIQAIPKLATIPQIEATES